MRMKSTRQILSKYRTDISYSIGQAEDDISKILPGIKWINVSDRLPTEIDEDYLIVVRNKNKERGIAICDIANFNGDGKWIKSNVWEDVVYWAKLPNLPF